MRKLFLAIMMVGGLSQMAVAHEGHDKTPGAIAAPHGGVVKGTSQLYLELVVEAGGFKIFPLTHDLAAIPAKDLSLQATATFPKKAKAEAVTLNSSDDGFAAKVDAKGAYRYSLDVTIQYKGKKEVVKFQVEPQS